MNYYAKALEIIEQRGWASGRIGEGPKEPTCAGGALAEAITGDPENIYATHNDPIFEEMKPHFIRLLDHAWPEWRERFAGQFAWASPEDVCLMAGYRWNDIRGEDVVKQDLRELAELAEATD